MAKEQCMAKVVQTEPLAEDIYSMWLLAPEIAGQAVSGQFISLFCEDGDKLLPRPISLCEIDRDRGMLRIVYRVVGAGTREFSRKNEGDTIRIMGPLGNGFPLEDKKAVLIAGGIGIPPMLQLAKELSGEVTVVVGYRDSRTFLRRELEEAADRVLIATEDGSVGVRGNVMDAIAENGLEADLIYACGPMPMLRAIKSYAAKKQITAYLSLEERMACGVGACLGCVCRTVHKDHHSHVNNARICTDGPVFDAGEVDI